MNHKTNLRFWHVERRARNKSDARAIFSLGFKRGV